MVKSKNDCSAVLLEQEGPGEGLYVPMEAVVELGAQSHIFTVSGDGEGGQAKKTPVTVVGLMGELARIEGDGLTDGSRVILKGAHYLVDGEPVRILAKEEI